MRYRRQFYDFIVTTLTLEENIVLWEESCRILFANRQHVFDANIHCVYFIYIFRLVVN